MKFHCDRCKTRYSIADERVRGKILKIRCKNCSSVITVKETGQVSPPRLPDAGDGPRTSRQTGGRRHAPSTSGSALQGAFEQALRRPQRGSGADGLTDAPAVLEAEWYVSQDGEQYGPFPLQRVQDWVALRAADEELYCWSEGFDDWLPVDKVSHFRGLRGQGPGGRHTSGMLPLTEDNDRTVLSPPPSHVLAAAGGEEPEETPVPLFAATLAQVMAEAPSESDDDEAPAPMFGKRNGSAAASLPTSRPPVPAGNAPGAASLFGAAAAAGAMTPPSTGGETRGEESHDLEIGEASRVVKLPMLARNLGSAAPAVAPGLPGLADAGAGALGRGTGSHDQSGGALHGLPIIQGGSSVDIPRPEILLPRRRRSGMAVPLLIGSAVVVGVVSVLLIVALTGDDEDALLRRGKLGGDGLAYQFERDGKKGGKESEPAASKSGARRVRKNTGTRPGAAPAAGGVMPVGPGSSDEVDLSASGDAPRELDPDDLFDVYNANKIGVQMCYNNALKRDPLLSIKRADVFISVGTSGSVSSVSIPSLSGTPLGDCLEKRIRVWKFPRATQVFNSQFPIIFQT